MINQKAFEGRNILILHPDFFGLGNIIAEALRAIGASVETLSTRPIKSILTRGLIRVSPLVGGKIVDGILYSSIANLEKLNFDTVLMVGGEGLTFAMVKYLRKKLPQAKFVAYLWDSIRNHPYHVQKLFLFDKVFSFDFEDCLINKNWIYRPLFAADPYWNVIGPGESSIYFMGSYHAERLAVLRRFKNAGRISGIAGRYEMLSRGWIDSIRWRSVIGGDDIERLRTPLPPTELADRFSRHSAVLDIHHLGQSGLTLRTFEALAAGRKLITTNQNIVREPFYNPNRIQVIDRNLPKIDLDFLLVPFIDETPRLPMRYSIQGWVREVVEK